MTPAVETPPAPAERLYTADDLLAMPDDGVERWIIRGQLRERRDTDMTKRNRFHARLEAWISHLLCEWLERQPEPRGGVYSGEAGVRLRRDPDTSVGIDVVYLSPELEAAQTDDTTLIDGVPTLVVEISSPNDVRKEVTEKTNGYLAAGVPLVWAVDTDYNTVTVYRPGRSPQLFDTSQELSADPHLPGFVVPVARIFRR